MSSILNTIKKLNNVPKDDTNFDLDIVSEINAVFSTLTQLGVGPDNGFSIEDDSAEWSDYIPEGPTSEAVRSYIAKKVRLSFDPPQNSTVRDIINKSLEELEWRIVAMVESQKS